MKPGTMQQKLFPFLTRLICALLLWISIPQITQAQFLRLQLVVEEETGVVRGQRLDPGLIRPNAGWVEVGVTDEFAGRFSISTQENINLGVTVNAPAELVLDAGNSMPMNFYAAYLNDGTDNPANATPLEADKTVFPISDCGCLLENMHPDRHQLIAHLFFYADLYAGDIQPGIYHGEVQVSIEYF